MAAIIWKNYHNRQFLVFILLMFLGAHVNNGSSLVSEEFEQGNVFYRAGQLIEAERMYHKVMISSDQDFAAHAACNRGSVLLDMGRIDDALQSYKQALFLNPEHGDAHFNIGVLQQDMKLLDQAENSYRSALRTDPSHVHAMSNLGSVLQAQQKHRLAAEVYYAAVDTMSASDLNDDEFENFRGSLNYALGTVLQRLEVEDNNECSRGQCSDEALKAFRSALKADPGHHLAAHAVAAYAADSSMKAASNEYVTALFDDYATSFDESLKSLGYKAPDVVATALADALGLTSWPSRQSSKPLIEVALDIGCGTGLLGPLIRSLTTKLIGVDLSPAMIAQASKKMVYDELVAGDMLEKIAAFRHHKIGFIGACDVLVYIGDLNDVFSRVSNSLFTGGLFIFSTELLPSGASIVGWKLQTSGRFAHEKRYLETLAELNGFRMEKHLEFVPRFEMGKPILGQVAVLRRK